MYNVLAIIILLHLLLPVHFFFAFMVLYGPGCLYVGLESIIERL